MDSNIVSQKHAIVPVSTTDSDIRSRKFSAFEMTISAQRTEA